MNSKNLLGVLVDEQTGDVPAATLGHQGEWLKTKILYRKGSTPSQIALAMRKLIENLSHRFAL